MGWGHSSVVRFGVQIQNPRRARHSGPSVTPVSVSLERSEAEMGGCLEVWCSHAGVDSKKQETLPHTGWTERTNTQGCTLNPTHVMACMHCPHTQTQKTEKNSMQRKKKTYKRKMNQIQLLSAEWMVSVLLNQREKSEESTYPVWFYLYKV